MGTVLDNGQVKLGLVGLTGTHRLVIVTEVDPHYVKLISLPQQPLPIDGNDFYAPLIRGQVPYRTAASLWLRPVHLEKLHEKNREFLAGLTLTPLGATEVGYVHEVPIEESAVRVTRVKITEPVEERPTRKSSPRVKAGGKFEVSGKTAVIPELRRETQFQQLHAIAQELGAFTLDELVQAAVISAGFGNYTEQTVRWLVKMMAKHGILQEV